MLQSQIIQFVFGPLLFIFLLVILTNAIKSAKSGSPSRSLPIQKKPILSNHELAFAGKLSEAIADQNFVVCPQVSMSAFIEVLPNTDPKVRSHTRNRYAQKYVDFLLVDDDANAILIIELDDRSHVAEKDKKRDEMTLQAGIKTLRLRNGYKITADEIRREIDIILNLKFV